MKNIMILGILLAIVGCKERVLPSSHSEIDLQSVDAYYQLSIGSEPDVFGYNPDVYEFSPRGLPNKRCIWIVASSGSSNLECYDKED